MNDNVTKKPKFVNRGTALKDPRELCEYLKSL